MKTRKWKDKKYHIVFGSKEEFEKYFLAEEGVVPPLIPWRECTEVGQWVIADDDGIAQVLAYHTYVFPAPRKRTDKIVKTVVGVFLVSSERKKPCVKQPYRMDTDFDLHPNQYTYSGYNNGESARGQLRRIGPKERSFVKLFALGQNPYDLVVKLWPDSKPAWKLRNLLQRKKVVDAIKRELKDVARDLGIDDEYIFKGLKRLHEKSKSEQVKLESVVRLGKIIGTIEEGVKPYAGGGGAISGFKGFGVEAIAAAKETDKFLNGGFDEEEASFNESTSEKSSNKDSSKED